MSCEMETTHAGDARNCYWWMECLIWKKWSHHICRRVLFVEFPRCRFQGQCSKQIYEYPLLQASLVRSDAENQRIDNCSVTEQHLHSWSLFLRRAWRKSVSQACRYKSGSSGAQLVPNGIRIQIICCNSSLPNWTHTLSIKISNLSFF